MLRIYTFLLLGICLLFSWQPLQAQLNPGDIMFVGYAGDGNGEPDENGNPDANCADAFAFAALVDIPANTTIYFTEAAYNNSTGFEATDGDVSWSNSVITPAGTIVNVTTNEEVNPCAPITANIGTAQFVTTIVDSWALSSSNQVIYAYLGTVRMPTVWLAAFISDNSSGFAQFPPALTGFIIDFTIVDPDVDVAVLSNAVDCNNREDCLAYILDLNNWITEDDIGFGACCDDDGINYPEDLPGDLEACVAPVINGITLVDCGNGVSGDVTLEVDGELNGATTWQWLYLNEPCENPLADVYDTGSQVTGNYFDYINSTFYVRATGGCVTEPVCFAFVPSELLGQPASFSLSVSIYCTDAGVQTGLTGGSPAGGVYSGTGVTDDGNGMTFTFDPAATTGGASTVTYTYNTSTACGNSTATASITVAALPTVTFTAPGPFLVDDASLALTSGMPEGGTYSGPGVTDNTFDPATAGVGTHTITYSYTDGNGCMASTTGEITITAALSPDNECAGANDISALFGQAPNEAQTSTLFDNTGYNSTGDPETGYDCFFDNALQKTVWFSFTGDGNVYQIKTVQCTATDYFDEGDTQVAIYSGDCSNPTPVGCNEDEDEGNLLFNFNIEVMTEEGVTYLMMIDGWDGRDGEFCIEVTNLSPSSVTPIEKTAIKIHPNPTSSLIYLENVVAEQVEVLDNTGRLVRSHLQPGNSVDLSGLPAGVYFLRIATKEAVYSAKVVKE